jgi:hypothetical protein
MAQTAPDALFEPVLIVAGLSIAYLVDYIYIYKTISYFFYFKKTREFKKTQLIERGRIKEEKKVETGWRCFLSVPSLRIRRLLDERSWQ